MKKHNIRIISFAAAAALLLQLIPAAAFAENENEGYIEFGVNNKTRLMNAGMASKDQGTVVEYENRSAWVLTNADGVEENASVDIDVEEALSGPRGEQNVFELEVDYYDNPGAEVAIKYISRNMVGKTLGTIKTSVTGSKGEKNTVRMWRTAKFIIQDDAFNTSKDYPDIRISGYTHFDDTGWVPGADTGYGSYTLYYYNNYTAYKTLEPFVLGAVRLRKLDKHNPFNIKLSTPTTSNTFFDDEPALFYADIENTSDNVYTLNATYYLMDDNDVVRDTKTDTVTVSTGEGTTRASVDFGQTFFGCGYMKAVFEADGIQNITQTKFSRSREAKIKNEHLGTNVHLDGAPTFPIDIEKVSELLSKAGYSGARHTVRWPATEPSKETYTITPASRKGMECAKKYGFKILPIVGDPNTNIYPTFGEPEDMAAYAKYVEYVAKEYREVADYIETYNEINLHQTAFTPEKFVDTFRASYNGVKAANNGMQLLGVDWGGLDVRALRNMFEAGALDNMDAVSYHIYYHSRVPSIMSFFTQAMGVKNLMAEYGKPDMPLWVTENGWTDCFTQDLTTEDAAAAHAITILINAAWKVLDQLYFYEFYDDGVNSSFQENKFGIVSSVFDEVPFSAKKAYPAVCNVNWMLGGAEFSEALGGLKSDDDRYVYRFKRKNDDGRGEDVIAMWANNERYDIGLKLGTDSLKLYDMYGNESELYGVDGKYSFALGMNPIYIVGTFPDFEQCEAPIGVNGSVFSGVKNDKVVQIITLPDSLDAGKAKIVQRGSNYFRHEENEQQNGNTVVYTVNTPDERFFDKNTEYDLYVDGKLYYSGNIFIRSSETISVQIENKRSDHSTLNRWEMDITVKNNSNSQKLSGSADMVLPEEYAGIMQKLVISGLKPQSSQKFRVFMPEISSKEMRNFKMDMKLSNGESFTFTKKMFFTVVPKVTGARPVIDGKASPGEYIDDAWFDITVGENFQNIMFLEPGTTHMGDDDLSAKATMRYDDDNMYMFIDVTDDTFVNKNTETMAWNGDSIQLGIADEVSTSGLYCEMTIALTPDGPQMFRNLTNNAANPVGLVSNKELSVTREGNHTLYEIALPWSEVVNDVSAIRSGARPKFAILINEDDGAGRNSYMEYSQILGSIGTYKNADWFSDMILSD